MGEREITLKLTMKSDDFEAALGQEAPPVLHGQRFDRVLVVGLVADGKGLVAGVEVLEGKGLALAGLPRRAYRPGLPARPALCKRLVAGHERGCGVWHERLLVCGKQGPARRVPASGP